MKGVTGGQAAAGLCVLWLGLLPTGPAAPVPAALSAPAEIDRGPLSVELPHDLPKRESRAGWDEVVGVVEHSGTTVRYRLFVNPEFGALYQITQYRMWKSDGSGVETEKVLWNENPGSHAPLRVFELLEGRWQPIAVGTPAYTREIIHAIRVYDLHRQAWGFDAGFE